MSITLAVYAGSSSACDELIGKLLSGSIRPAIEKLDCSILGKAGLNRAEHRLGSVCYTSHGSYSTLQLNVTLSCKTSDAALIKAQISENISAELTIQASDCQITKVNISASGAIGQLLLKGLNPGGLVRTALQPKLNERCGK